ncbi:MAG: DNA translocase FtsK 4TM domain-containing protein, partial [Anaerolineales bacterium]|nr:DNA translocase FtsK 4TM domain-containing protein [Anaerolineales bacterium]
MAQRRASKEQSKESKNLGSRFGFKLSPKAQREILGIVFFLAGALALLTLLRVTRGTVGDLVANFLLALFGWGAYPLPFLAFGAGAFLLRRGDAAETEIAWGRIFSAEIFFAVVLALMHLIAAPTDPGTFAQSGGGGGFVGWALASATTYFLGATPSIVVLIILGLLTLPAILGLSTAHLRAWSNTLAERAEHPGRTSSAPIKLPSPKPKPDLTSLRRESAAPKTQPTIIPPTIPSQTGETPPSGARPTLGTKPPMKTATASQTILTPRNRARRKAPALPALDILDIASEAKYGETDANRKARVIEETLANFGIPAKVIEIHAGPTVTQFGLEPGFIERR